MAVKMPEDWRPEKREEAGAGALPNATTTVDNYPDGGLVAWCVVLGVSTVNSPSPCFLSSPNRVVHVCHFRDVGYNPQAER